MTGELSCVGERPGVASLGLEHQGACESLLEPGESVLRLVALAEFGEEVLELVEVDAVAAVELGVVAFAGEDGLAEVVAGIGSGAPEPVASLLGRLVGPARFNGGDSLAPTACVCTSPGWTGARVGNGFGARAPLVCSTFVQVTSRAGKRPLTRSNCGWGRRQTVLPHPQRASFRLVRLYGRGGRREVLRRVEGDLAGCGVDI